MPAAKKDVRLRDWAAKHKIPYRTAISWANKKKIPAERDTRIQVVRSTKTVTGYFIDQHAKPPRTVKR
jgi:hypothetical protein